MTQQEIINAGKDLMEVEIGGVVDPTWTPEMFEQWAKDAQNDLVLKTKNELLDFLYATSQNITSIATGEAFNIANATLDALERAFRSNILYAQSFVSPNSFANEITISLYLSQVGLNEVVVQIRKDSGSNTPSSEILVEIKKEDNLVGNPGWKNFIDYNMNLPAGTLWIVISAPDSTIDWKATDSISYTGGILLVSTDGGTTWSNDGGNLTNKDIAFKVIGKNKNILDGDFLKLLKVERTNKSCYIKDLSKTVNSLYSATVEFPTVYKDGTQLIIEPTDTAVVVVRYIRQPAFTLTKESELPANWQHLLSNYICARALYKDKKQTEGDKYMKLFDDGIAIINAKG